MLLVDPSMEDTCKDIDVDHFVVMGTDSDDQMYLPGGDPQPWTPDEDVTATINYTSGTTARPKGVQQTHCAYGSTPRPSAGMPVLATGTIIFTLCPCFTAMAGGCHTP